MCTHSCPNKDSKRTNYRIKKWSYFAKNCFFFKLIFENEGLLYANCWFYILTINTKYFSLIKLCYTYAHSHSIFSFSFHFGWPNLPNFTLVIKIMTDCITLLHMSFYICCDFKTFHLKIDHLKTILIKNNYPSNFIDSRKNSISCIHLK